MKVVLLALAGIVLTFVALEVALVKVSRYRLTHGDGREHTFRKGPGSSRS